MQSFRSAAILRPVQMDRHFSSPQASLMRNSNAAIKAKPAQSKVSAWQQAGRAATAPANPTSLPLRHSFMRPNTASIFTHLRQYQHVRLMHHAQRYLACEPSAPPPMEPSTYIPMRVKVLRPEEYKIVSRDDSVDSWLWLRPGNKVGRITIGSSTQEGGEEEGFETKRREGESFEWTDIAPWLRENEADRLVLFPIEEPTTEEPFAVRSLSYSRHAKGAGKLPPPAAAASASARGPPGTNTGEVAPPLYTAEMLGSKNDPRTRAAIKQAQIQRRAYNRFIKEGPLVPAKEHVLDFLARKERERQAQNSASTAGPGRIQIAGAGQKGQ
ncbi:hypothetical protein OC842_003502 [Tilletia horrida]|uniref:Uncharacterized protein n=1 Tax=Tilletia horrida TaxID=155126 RepID=A0AAN6GDV3_9BASI|nr:hypothetical protein OC842_003502 [Tilletia horrida]